MSLLKMKSCPNLQRIETTNFAAMKDAEAQPSGIIITQTLLLGLKMVVLTVALMTLSFWLRNALRRYISPGIDSAMVLVWLLMVGQLGQLVSLPEILRGTVEDAYYSVTASSRVLVLLLGVGVYHRYSEL